MSMLIFCLAGINTVDLYELQKESLDISTWTLKYNRIKTKKERADKAYTEIVVPNKIRPLFTKYEGKKGLFCFRDNYHCSNQFNKTVNINLKRIVERRKLTQITTYSFRHSWATIAQNKCKATLEQVAFALNHTTAHKITEGYIEKDYTPISQLNQKVIDYIFKRRIKRETLKIVYKKRQSPSKRKTN